MILGTGIDIIEVARMQALMERYGERFIQRILRPDEAGYCLGHKHPAPYVAARFAAKEAIAKAFGTGIGRDLGWQDLEVGRQSSGAPFVILHDRAEVLLAQRGATTVQLSLSHTQNYAVAMAILERV